MNKKKCPSCEAELPTDASHGLCPACVLRGALQSESPVDVPSVEKIQAAFPEFKILECIGRGGMGIVYKAEQAALGRCVALKILDPSLSGDPGFAERFGREARTLGKLAHPNIVAIHEFGEREGFFWLTMEFVEGVNLRQAMQTSIFTPQQALAVIPDLCAALQFAHNQGVLHRDIKPENILLDTRGHVKIADFGIARLAGEQADFTLTHTGSALGSAAYMAPEQIESPHDVDHRADIYSLGVVFYEMLTGSLPLGRFPAPSEKSTSDPRLDEVVFRALAKEREDRFQSAGAVNEGVKTASQSTAASEQPSKKSDSKFQNWIPLTVIGGAAATLIGLFTSPLLCGLGATAFVLGLVGLWQSAPEMSPTESAQRFEKWSLFFWMGGVLAAVIASFFSHLLFIFGATAAVLGLVGCWISLSRIKAGTYRSDRHQILLLLAFWPVVIAISIFSFSGYFAWLESYSAEGTPLISWQPFLFFLIALLIPSLLGSALWKLVGTKGVALKSRLSLAAACILIVVSALAAKISYVGSAHFEAYEVEGLQFPPNAEDLEGQALVQAAMKEAMGSFADHYSVRYFTKPNERGGSYEYFAEVEIAAGSRDAARQHARRLEERLRSLLPEALRQSGSFRSDRKEVIRGISQRYRLLILPLLVSLPLIVIIAVLSSGKRTAMLLIFAVGATIAVSRVSWWPHSHTPPLSVGMAPPPPVLPPMEYDFTTTRDAMESMIKAAKKGDKEGFSRGLTSEYREALLNQDSGLAEMMQAMAMTKYGGQQARQGDDATVRLISPDFRGNMNLVRVNREWKFPKPDEPEYDYSVPLGTIHSMVKAAKADDYGSFDEGFDTAIYDMLMRDKAKYEALRQQFKRLVGIKQIELESDDSGTAVVAAMDGDLELRFSMILADVDHVYSSGTSEQKAVTIKQWRITQIE